MKKSYTTWNIFLIPFGKVAFGYVKKEEDSIPLTTFAWMRCAVNLCTGVDSFILIGSISYLKHNLANGP